MTIKTSIYLCIVSVVVVVMDYDDAAADKVSQQAS